MDQFLPTVLDHVKKLSQQIIHLEEFIGLKFGADYKEFKDFKRANPKMTIKLVTTPVVEEEEPANPSPNFVHRDQLDEYHVPVLENIGGDDTNISGCQDLCQVKMENCEDDQENEEEKEIELNPRWTEDSDEDIDNFVVNLPSPGYMFREAKNGVNFHAVKEEKKHETVENPLHVQGPKTRNAIKIKHPRKQSHKVLTTGIIKCLVKDMTPPSQVPPPPISSSNGLIPTPAKRKTNNQKKLTPCLKTLQSRRKTVSKSLVPSSKVTPRRRTISAYHNDDMKEPLRHSQFGVRYHKGAKRVWLMYDNHAFRLRKVEQSGRRYWKCQDADCPSRFNQTAKGGGKLNSTHTHPPLIEWEGSRVDVIMGLSENT